MLEEWTTRARRLARSVRRQLQPAPAAPPPPPSPPVTGPIDVTCRHLSASVEATVRDWFEGRIGTRELSGERSVIISHPDTPSRRLKIKGAGLNGAPLTFERHHASGLKAPLFDFEGRMMEDVAAGHDNAYLGGASFQQVAVEHRVSARLVELGYNVVPCLGYGTVTRNGRTSWFGVFDWHPDWVNFAPPNFPVERYGEACIDYGDQVLELATKHRLVGYYWYIAAKADGLPIVKDVHPFYAIDPISTSRLSWTTQVYFALHIVSLTALLSPRIKDVPGRPPDLQAYPFRSLVPDATAADHEALRWNLVAPYFRDGPPPDFDPFTLERVLREHRITRAIMERCPPEFAALRPLE